MGLRYVYVEDNVYVTPFPCRSSKEVKPGCKTTHRLCSFAMLWVATSCSMVTDV